MVTTPKIWDSPTACSCNAPEAAEQRSEGHEHDGGAQHEPEGAEHDPPDRVKRGMFRRRDPDLRLCLDPDDALSDRRTRHIGLAGDRSCNRRRGLGQVGSRHPCDVREVDGYEREDAGRQE